MRKITLEIDEKTFTLLEKIQKHYNEEDGFDASIDETLESLITAHYLCEVKSENKDNIN